MFVILLCFFSFSSSWSSFFAQGSTLLTLFPKTSGFGWFLLPRCVADWDSFCVYAGFGYFALVSINFLGLVVCIFSCSHCSFKNRSTKAIFKLLFPFTVITTGWVNLLSFILSIFFNTSFISFFSGFFINCFLQSEWESSVHLLKNCASSSIFL